MSFEDDLPEQVPATFTFRRDPLAYARPGQEARLPKERRRDVRMRQAAKRLLRDYGIELTWGDR